MSKDRLKYRERFSTTVDPKVLIEFKAYSNATDIPVSRLIDQALSHLAAGGPEVVTRDTLLALKDGVKEMINYHTLTKEEPLVLEHEIAHHEGFLNGYRSALFLVIYEIDNILRDQILE